MATAPQIGVLSPLFDVSFAEGGGAGGAAFASVTSGGGTRGEEAVPLRVHAPGDRAVFQSRRFVAAAAGCTRIATVVGRLGAGGPGIRSRAGAFDCADDRLDDPRGDGYMFERCDGLNYVVERSSADGGRGTDVRVPQSSWNLDRLDGGGLSGLTFDASAVNAFLIVQEQVAGGAASVKMGVLARGSVTYVHRFDGSAARTASLPVRFELECLEGGGGGAAEADAASASVSSSGGPPTGVRRSLGGRAAARDVSISMTSCPALSARLSASGARATCRLSALHLTCTSAAYYELVRGGELEGAAWVPPPSGASAEYDVSATAVSGGAVVTSGFASPGVTYDVSLKGEDVPPLTSDIAGLPEIYTLNVVCLMSSGLAWTSLDVEELR
ncbi:hypothetical protein JKP88DRAFT_291259 [Tribonema minus]|uniref:Uncharacterized protein n=1 Tax=Tribonema minus TaxID=303371 RepID=A0A835ZKZ0_9STRA|nr:hypothetical protein JKP88DRAFT_291259 [Tribonema minus]